MDLAVISEHGIAIRNLFEGLLETDMAAALERLVREEQWELLGAIAVSANEVPARRIIGALLEHNCYRELVAVACFRRQVRRQELLRAPVRARRAFRDFDAEDVKSGIPDHILQEAQDISDAAEVARTTALAREAAIDRDALRELIVTEIATRLNGTPDAAEALLGIAKASAFEDARRNAALRLANHEMSVKRLANQGRWADLIALAENSGLESVRVNTARALGPQLGAIRSDKDWASLRWAGMHHPDPRAREAIGKVLDEESQPH
jgi:hypothetical protein